MAARRVRREARDLLELVLVPGLAAVLPWSWCFKVFRWVARWDFLYRETSDRAVVQAQRFGGMAEGEDVREWARNRRLVTLVDYADYYLSRTRSNAWMRRHLEVVGAWPESGVAGLLCTYHWGAGMWGLRHAAESGMSAHALVAPLQGAHFSGRTVLHRYAKARIAEVVRALGQPTLDVSASLRPALKALRNCEQVLAVVDVPADQVSTSAVVPFLNRHIRIPRGLLRMAADQGLPVTIYVTGLNLLTGRRELRVVQLGATADVDVLIQKVFEQMEATVEESSVAWHFWSEAERFFVADSDQAAD